MNKKLVLLIILIAFQKSLFAQGEANNWFFGSNVGISFDLATGNVNNITGSALNTNEGCAAISGSEGDLLFYTDGSTIWNRNHQAMPNGTGLLGNSTSTQSAIIVPKPNSDTVYYVFTVDGFFNGEDNPYTSSDGLNYSEVDMSLNGGLGDVVMGQKNINLLPQASEKITAVKSADCSSFWVITHFLEDFYSFKVTSAGVELAPVATTIAPLVSADGYRYNAIGYLKASPNGKKLAIAHHSNGNNSSMRHAQPGELMLYDFDNATGMVSNGLSLLYGPSPYGIEFSPNSLRLYASIENITPGPNFVSSEILSYNLEATDIPGSMNSLIGEDTSVTVAGALQLGPDGKIYRAMRGTSFLSTIENPDSLIPTYVANSVSLNGAAQFGLPPFIQSLFAPKVDIINNDNDPDFVTNSLVLCEGEAYTLSAENITGGTYSWTKDGNAIATPTPPYELEISESGTYLVEIDPNNGECPFLGEAIVTINPLPIINNLTGLESCYDPVDGESDFDLTLATAEALAGQAIPVVIDSYHTNQADALSGANPISTPYSSAGGTVYIRLLNTATGCVNAVPLDLIVNPLPVVNSPVVLEQCDDDTDGVTDFNLTEANVSLSTNSATETFVYFESMTDAQANTSPIATPTAYSSGTGTSVYARITSAKGCVNYGEVVLNVGTTQIPAGFIREFYECDDDFDGIANFDFSSAHADILALFPGNTNITVSYYENQADALAETNAIADISNYQNSTPTTQEIWVRIDSNDVNACLGLGHHITLHVNPLPPTVTLDDYEVCSDTTTGIFDLDSLNASITGGDTNILVSYHESVTDAENNVDAISSPYTSTNTTVYIRAENTTTQCANTFMEVTLVAFPNPTITVPSPLEICDDENADGFAEFDLTFAISEITSDTSMEVSFHLNQSDADNNINPQGVDFTNTSAYNQTLVVRVTNPDTGCYSTVNLDLEVKRAPQGYPLTESYTSCDADNDGYAIFDLAALIDTITGGATDVTVSFYETLAQANSENPSQPTLELNYTNINPNTQTIYAKIVLIGLECYTIIEIDLETVNSPILPLNRPYPFVLCDTAANNSDSTADGMTSFDLDSLETELLAEELAATGNDVSDYTVDFYTDYDENSDPQLTGLINPSSAYVNASNPQVIYASVTYANSGCTSIIPIQLEVNSPPQTHFYEYALCFDTTVDETLYFDLTTIPENITNETGANSFAYYTTEADAIAGSNPIAEALLTAYPHNPPANSNAEDIWVRAENEIGCATIQLVTLVANPNPTPATEEEIIADLGYMVSCDNDGTGPGTLQEGYALFDLTLYEAEIIDNEHNVGVSYYTSEEEAIIGLNPIENPEAFYNTEAITPDTITQTIWVRVTNTGGENLEEATGCYTVTSFKIHVAVPQVSLIADKDTLCLNDDGLPLSDVSLPVLTAVVENLLGGATEEDYEFQWFLNDVEIPGATAATFTASQAGTYTVVVTGSGIEGNTTPGPQAMSCQNSASIAISLSASPGSFEVDVTTQAFADGHIIEASASSSQDGVQFVYSLDNPDGPYQESGTFTNVTPGHHIVYIKDAHGCGRVSKAVFVVDYPRFFSPNNDNRNDTWNIYGINQLPISKIYIFDRYGRLLKQLDPDSNGWDGTYNGSPMPSTDYWFKIIYLESNQEKEFIAHFSLKR